MTNFKPLRSISFIKLLKHRSRGQRGIYFVLGAAVLFMLFTIGALVIGTGFIVLDNIKLQNLANVAAQAAIEGYSLKYNKDILNNTSSNSANTNQHTRATTYALNLAKQEFSKNKLYSGSTSIAEDLDIGGIGDITKLEFGKYATVEDSSTKLICNGIYPCFIQINPDTNPTNINAVKIHGKTKTGDNLIAPFTKAVGFIKDGLFGVDVSATAVIIPKCISLMVDTSDLSFRDSHFYSIGSESITRYDNNSNGRITYPVNPGVFAYPGSIKDTDCMNLPTVSDGLSSLKNYWCNLSKTPIRGGNGNLIKHALSDYQPMAPIATRAGYFFIDNVNLPQPLARYTDSLNGFLQAYAKTIGIGDKVVLYAFADMTSKLTKRGFVDRIPEYGTGANSYPATNEIGFLAQILNINNIGKVGDDGKFISGKEPRHPNLIDRGWFPAVTDSNMRVKSNLPLAIATVVDEMNQFCPSESSKNIIVATHGAVGGSFQINPDGSYLPVSIDSYSALKGEMSQVVLGSVNNVNIKKANSSIAPPPNTDSSIISKLNKWGMKLSVLHASSRTQPNFCNRSDPSNNNPNRFLKLSDLFFAGFRSSENQDCSVPVASTNVKGTNVKAFSNSKNAIPQLLVNKCGMDIDNCAYKYLGDVEVDSSNDSNNVFLRYPNYLLSEMALGTKGTYCPLIRIAPVTEYLDKILDNNVPDNQKDFTPDQLKPNLRVVDQPQVLRVENLTDGGVGAACFGDILASHRSYLLD